MAASAMGRYLAIAAREARERHGRKPYQIAATPPGTEGFDPSTVWRFEQAGSWPRDPDRMIDLYAADLDIEPLDLWKRALELWQDATPDEATPNGTEKPPGPGGALGREIAAEPPRSSGRTRRRNRAAEGRRRGTGG